MASCSLLVINYHAARLALEAIATARRAYAGTLQVVVVDNSEDPAEAETLRGVDTLLVSGRNLGYAGAINAGRRSCEGDTLLIANPDVRFAPGAIDRLLAEKAAVAGPAIFWDEAFEWLAPPAELGTSSELLDRVVASRSAVWARIRDRRRFRMRMRFWSLSASSPVNALSGAVMAIKTAAFDAAGGFDERFPLYFEEHDFLRRVPGEIVYVPEAKVRHLYNQSAGGSVAAASYYATSEARYLKKWSVPFGTPLKRMERSLGVPWDFSPFPDEGIDLPEEDVVVEASPLPSFETAAGCFPRSRTLRIPDEIWDSYKSDVLYVRLVQPRSGRTLAAFSKAKMK